ncbi:MAG TPA: aldo/keto reductase [Chloroflexota bacterium]|nr:aldo/keto reductase [Chloroflexota bacterium]
MEYRRMGKSDLIVSAVGFGCWEMGGSYGDIDNQEVTTAIRRALELGVTLYDTARGYGAGRSEEILGRALGADRNNVIVVTKCALPTRPEQKSRRDARYDSIMKDVELSLQSLGTDYIDLLLVHWPDVETPIPESMRALNDLRGAGKVRHVGVSNFSAAQLREGKQFAPLIANQVGYNLFDRRWEYEMFPTAEELGIGIMAYGPLAHGLLTGTFTAETAFGGNDWRARGLVFGQALFTPENLPKNVEVVDRLKRFAAKRGITLPRLALAWVLSNPQVSVALSGTRRPSEIEENVEALTIKLTAEDKAELATIMQDAAGQVKEIPT